MSQNMTTTVGHLPVEYEYRRLTSPKFMELAQVFFARRSVWTADEVWVNERLVDLARVPRGRFLPEATARRMYELAFHPTPPSPAQRAKMEGDGKAEFLDVWLRELGEDREWLGCAGGPAFGPKRVWIEPTRVRTHDRDCLCLQCLDEAGRGR